MYLTIRGTVVGLPAAGIVGATINVGQGTEVELLVAGRPAGQFSRQNAIDVHGPVLVAMGHKLWIVEFLRAQDELTPQPDIIGIPQGADDGPWRVGGAEAGGTLLPRRVVKTWPCPVVTGFLQVAPDKLGGDPICRPCT
jgi:hypothetical protein